jgi:hypothetical protein
VFNESVTSKLVIMKIKLFVTYGLVALATGAFLEVGPPVKADPPSWVRTERVQFLKAVGTVPLGWRSHNGNQLPAVKVEQDNAVQASQLHKDDERLLNIYRSLSFLGGA